MAITGGFLYRGLDALLAWGLGEAARLYFKIPRIGDVLVATATES